MTSVSQFRREYCRTCNEDMQFDELGCPRCRTPFAGQPVSTVGRFNPLRSMDSEIRSRKSAGKATRDASRYPAKFDELCTRESEFAVFLGRGLTVVQAGIRMGISRNAQKGYLYRVTLKAGLPPRSGEQAVAEWARKHFSLTDTAAPPSAVLTPATRGPAVSSGRR